MKTAINILRAIITLILSAFFIINAWYFVNINFLGNPFPDIGGWSLYQAKDDTMAPSFSKGDAALIKLTQYAEPGNIVIYESGDSKKADMTRIVGTHEGSYIMRKETEKTEDESLLSPNSIVAVVTGRISTSGNIIFFFSSVWGLLVILFFEILLFILPSIILSDKKSKDHRYKE